MSERNFTLTPKVDQRFDTNNEPESVDTRVDRPTIPSVGPQMILDPSEDPFFVRFLSLVRLFTPVYVTGVGGSLFTKTDPHRPL